MDNNNKQQNKPKKQQGNKPKKQNQPNKTKKPKPANPTDKLTDCLYFLDGSCNKGNDCKYRHSSSLQQGPRKTCFKWEKDECNDASCSYLHLKKQKTVEKKEPKESKDKLMDCTFFLDGSCKKGDNCKYRHAPQAIHNEVCRNWKKGECSNISCNYRHPKNLIIPPTQTTPAVTAPPVVSPPIIPQPSFVQHPMVVPNHHIHQKKIAYFWDIENCPIPKSRSAFDIVQLIRTLAEDEAEECFACIGDTNKVPKKSQEELALANVTLNHVPQIKPGDADRVIVKEITRFASSHQTPNHTIVLISGDVDFIQQLSSLRNTSKYKVVLLHNAQARPELIKTASVSKEWNTFVNNSQKPQNQNASKKQQKPKTENNNNAVPKPEKPKKQENKQQNKPKKKQKEDKQFECLACSKAFKIRNSLEQHQEQKSHFVCAWCYESSDKPGPTFGSSESVAQHVEAKHEYECEMCGEFFGGEIMNEHKAAEAHFLCHMCMKSFQSQQALDQHQRVKDHAPEADSDEDSDSSEDEDDQDSDSSEDNLQKALRAVMMSRQQVVYNF